MKRNQNQENEPPIELHIKKEGKFMRFWFSKNQTLKEVRSRAEDNTWMNPDDLFIVSDGFLPRSEEDKIRIERLLDPKKPSQTLISLQVNKDPWKAQKESENKKREEEIEKEKQAQKKEVGVFSFAEKSRDLKTHFKDEKPTEKKLTKLPADMLRQTSGSPQYNPIDIMKMKDSEIHDILLRCACFFGKKITPEGKITDSSFHFFKDSPEKLDLSKSNRSSGKEYFEETKTSSSFDINSLAKEGYAYGEVQAHLQYVMNLRGKIDYSHSTQSTERKESRYVYVEGNYPKATFHLSEIRQELSTQVKNFFQPGETITKTKLTQFFDKFGYFVADSITVGGKYILMEEVTLNERDSKSLDQLKIELKGKFRKFLDAGVGMRYGNQEENKSESSQENHKYNLRCIGGDIQYKNNPNKWLMDLNTNSGNWAIIQQDLTPSYKYLDEAFQSQIESLLKSEEQRIESGIIGMYEGSDSHMLAGNGERQVVKYITFNKTFQIPPRVYIALSEMETKKSSNTRVNVFAQDITTHGFLIVFKTWADSKTASLTMNWVALLDDTKEGDIISFFDPEGKMCKEVGLREVRPKLKFARTFKNPPTVCLGINYLDTDNWSNARTNAYTKNISTRDCDIVFETWEDSKIYGMGVNCLIFEGIEHGIAGFAQHPTGNMRDGEGDREWRQKIQFSKVFQKPPAVVVGFSRIDTDKRRDIRIAVFCQNITCYGFDIVFKTWGDSSTIGLSANWIAFLPN